VPLAPDVVVVLSQAFQADLIVDRPTKRDDLRELLLGHRVAQDRNRTAAGRCRTIHRQKVRIEERVTAGQTELAAHPARAAEAQEIVEDPFRIGQAQGLA